MFAIRIKDEICVTVIDFKLPIVSNLEKLSS
jgi:hypothetical protein